MEKTLKELRKLGIISVERPEMTETGHYLIKVETYDGLLPVLTKNRKKIEKIMSYEADGRRDDVEVGCYVYELFKNEIKWIVKMNSVFSRVMHENII